MAGFADKWEPPRLEEKKGSFGWLWLIILFIAVGLVVVYLMQQGTQVVQSIETTAPAAQETVTTPASTVPSANVAASSAPEMNSHCTAVAGIIPGTTKRAGNTITVSFKNNGKVGIEGSYFEFSNADKKAYRKNSDAVAIGETKSYTVDLDDAATELGTAVKSFVILPIQNGKACLNQRMVVIK